MFLRIIAAWIYDLFAILSLSLGITGIEVILHRGVIAPHTLSHQVSLIIIMLVYYSFSLIKGGQTLGMRAWQLKLVTHTGNLTLLQSLKRFFFFLPACVWAVLSIKNLQTILLNWTNTFLESTRT